MAAKTSDELEDLAIESLRRSDMREPLTKQLVQTVIDCEPNDVRCQSALRLLFMTSCSNMGADVKVLKEPGAKCPVGVLVLGFAGANMGMLEMHRKVYTKLQPTWQVVVTTRPGMSGPRAQRALNARTEEVVAALAGCERLVVHVISNNGHTLWEELMLAHPELRARTAAMVYDCVGPGMMDPKQGAEQVRALEGLYQVVKQTILAAAFLWQVCDCL